MIPGELKPLLTALVLPPAGPLLLMALGALCAAAGWRRLSWAAASTGFAALWLASCGAVAVWLATHALPPVEPIDAAALRGMGAQAVVVLGGGIEAHPPEYGSAQPSGPTLARLRYGAYLARGTGLPMAFAGGVGWANSGTGVATEAQAARSALAEWGQVPRWSDDRSRDTAENAARLGALMLPSGTRRIALVTHAWHMPRAQRLFEAQGFEVLPAPMGWVQADGRPLLAWLPSASGLEDSRAVLREWLALRVQ